MRRLSIRRPTTSKSSGARPAAPPLPAEMSVETYEGHLSTSSRTSSAADGAGTPVDRPRVVEYAHRLLAMPLFPTSPRRSAAVLRACACIFLPPGRDRHRTGARPGLFIVTSGRVRSSSATLGPELRGGAAPRRRLLRRDRQPLRPPAHGHRRRRRDHRHPRVGQADPRWHRAHASPCVRRARGSVHSAGEQPRGGGDPRSAAARLPLRPAPARCWRPTRESGDPDAAASPTSLRA